MVLMVSIVGNGRGRRNQAKSGQPLGDGVEVVGVGGNRSGRYGGRWEKKINALSK